MAICTVKRAATATRRALANLRILFRPLGLTAVIVAGGLSIGNLTAGMVAPDAAPALQSELLSRNHRLHQPKPASAPTGTDGNAVELIGTIEAWPLPRQPRPQSAAPKRLDRLFSRQIVGDQQ